jgi:hypothetical protein
VRCRQHIVIGVLHLPPASEGNPHADVFNYLPREYSEDFAWFAELKVHVIALTYLGKMSTDLSWFVGPDDPRSASE